jgi:hypothetical protein
MAFYGHDVIQKYDSGEKIIDEQRFAYPVYVVFLLSPIVPMSFATAQTTVQVVLAMAVVSSALLWFSFLQPKRPAVTAWTTALLVAASPQIMQGLRLRQLALIVAFLIALATWLVFRNYLLLGGAVFALSTFKPQMVALPLSWFLLWSIGDLPKRWRFPAGFATMLVLLIGAGELILPGWHRDFLAGLAAYRRYGPFSSLLQLALGDTLGEAIAAVLVVGVLAWGWSKRKQGVDSPEFAFILSTFFVVTSLAFPLMVPFNQVLLILPVLLIVRDWAKLPLAARVVFAVCVSWPWMVSLALLVYRPDLKSLRLLPLLPSTLVFFLPFLVSVLLMARRNPMSASTAEI